MMDAMEETPKTLMNGFIIIISLMKLVHLIKLMVMIMELDVVLKLNAKTVYLVKDVGLKRELRFMGSINSEKLKVKKI